MTHPADPATREQSQPRPDRALRWPLFLAGLLGLSLAGHGAMLYMALNDSNFRVEPDYYRQGLAWDEHKDQARTNRKLGWQANGTLRAADDASSLVLVLRDADDQPLDGARVVARVFHNAHARQVVQVDLEPLGDGRYGASLPLRRPGLHTVRAEVIRGGDRFTCELKRDLGA